MDNQRLDTEVPSRCPYAVQQQRIHSGEEDQGHAQHIASLHNSKQCTQPGSGIYML